ncbi:MAG: hypothetical protein QOD83_460 [Solirubrobacteraceae bacterium]|jgi:dolichol-phosphate mannosyltransferase|nr:hypothetical protein [Solirubrobacteraceae bacterium]
MTDEAVAAPVAEAAIEARRGRRRRRVHTAVRTRGNWLQLVRFSTVGASGYIVNLAVYALLWGAADFDYRVAATGAFLVALTNNFLWNRAWTFRARDGHAGFQAARFCVVSLAAFVVGLLVLHILVERFGVDEIVAQAASIVCATPLNFVGNKLWSFRT